MLIQSSSENRFILFSIWDWINNTLQIPIIHSIIFILMIYPSKEPSIKPHFIEQSSLGSWMSKRVNLPTDSRRHLELFL